MRPNLIATTLIVLLLQQYSLAQLTPPEQDPAKRASLFAQLNQDVDAIEKQLNILKRVVRLVKPTVVHIEAQKTEGGFASRSVEEAGSGVIVEEADRFFVITNRHVITSASLSRIEIRLSDGRKLNPKQIREDPLTDIAVMEIQAPDLISAKLGDSRKVEIGDFVLAVGSPFGLSHSITYGIISAKGRRDLELGTEGVRYQDFMQTDAAINPGNSGGPLVNLRGEVIGINTAIASSSGGNEGIGFSIPIKMAIAVARQLIRHGRQIPAYLGVTMDAEFTQDKAVRLGMRKPKGVIITKVTEGSPADKGGIKINDVLLSFDGHDILDDAHLADMVRLTPYDAKVKVSVVRNKKMQTIELQLDQRSKFERN